MEFKVSRGDKQTTIAKDVHAHTIFCHLSDPQMMSLEYGSIVIFSYSHQMRLYFMRSIHATLKDYCSTKFNVKVRVNISKYINKYRKQKKQKVVPKTLNIPSEASISLS